jgi:hypothetical protein
VDWCGEWKHRTGMDWRQKQDKNCRENKQWNWVSEITERTGDDGDVTTFLIKRCTGTGTDHKKPTQYLKLLHPLKPSGNYMYRMF